MGPVAVCIRCLPFPSVNPASTSAFVRRPREQVRRIEDLQCDERTRESAHERERERERERARERERG